MDIKDKNLIITGGASGIGRALVMTALQRECRHVAVIDINPETLQACEQIFAGKAVSFHTCDMTDADRVQNVVAAIEADHGACDIFFSNAGIGLGDKPHWTVWGHSDADWQRGMDINLMSHIYAARAVVPQMVARGEGAFLITASAAGLLTQIGDVIYSVSKYASVGFADSLAISHGDDGLQVGLICPEGVATPLTANLKGGAQDANGVKTAEEAAETILEGVEAGKYFITTHESTAGFLAMKAQNYDRWVGGMRKFRRQLMDANGGVPIIIEDD